MNDLSVCVRMPYANFTLSVDLTLPAKGITSFFGSSGAGKTTLLRVIAGLERAPSAFVRIGEEIWQDSDKNIFVPTYKRSLGFVFQNANLFTHLSVKENIEFGMKRISEEQRKISLSQAVELLGIEHLMDRMPANLSGGEKQRVGIARALATSPRLLLLDEPLSALDMARKQEILPYLERLNKTLDIPMLYVSHALDEVVRLSDYLVLLEKGSVLASDAPHNLLTDLNYPLAHGENACSIIDGKLLRREEDFDLCCIGFSGGEVFFPNETLKIGDNVRLRIQARDVSLVLTQQQDTSILNSFPACVVDLQNDGVGQIMVCLAVGNTRLLCRITKKSANTLGLTKNLKVYAQVKAVAVI